MLQFEFGDVDQLLFHIADTLYQMDVIKLIHKTGNLAILLQVLSQLYEKLKFEKINNSIQKSKLDDNVLLKNEITTHCSSQINLFKLIIEKNLLIDYTPICFYSTSAQNAIIEISNLLINLNFEKMISIVSKVLNTPCLYCDAPILLNCDIIRQSKFSNVLKLLPLFIKLQKNQIPFSINNKEFHSILDESDFLIEFSISEDKFEITENSKILYKLEQKKINTSKFYSAVYYLINCIRNKKIPEFEKEFPIIDYPIIPTKNHPLFDLFPSEIKIKDSIITAVLSTMTNSLSYDIVYMVDSTGSMGSYLRALEEQCINISNELKKKLPNYDFKFGAIFYRDPVDSPSDIHETFLLSANVDSLKNKTKTIRPDGGADGPEDWVSAYQIALDRMNWRKGVRLIIHIADAPAHGHSYCGRNNHEEENDKLGPLLRRCSSCGIRIVGLPIGGNYAKQSYKQAEISTRSKFKQLAKAEFLMHMR